MGIVLGDEKDTQQAFAELHVSASMFHLLLKIVQVVSVMIKILFCWVRTRIDSTVFLPNLKPIMLFNEVQAPRGQPRRMTRRNRMLPLPCTLAVRHLIFPDCANNALPGFTTNHLHTKSKTRSKKGAKKCLGYKRRSGALRKSLPRGSSHSDLEAFFAIRMRTVLACIHL